MHTFQLSSIDYLSLCLEKNEIVGNVLQKGSKNSQNRSILDCHFIITATMERVKVWGTDIFTDERWKKKQVSQNQHVKIYTEEAIGGFSHTISQEYGQQGPDTSRLDRESSHSITQ